MVLAMPAEKSGQNEFDFEYGVGVRRPHRGLRPDVHQGARALQPARRRRDERAAGGALKELSRLAAPHERRFLFELLVPAEPHQLEAVGGDDGRYDRELRPDLMKVAIAELQETGIEADIWKIEGIDDPEQVRRDRRAVPHRRTRRRRVRRAGSRRRRRRGRSRGSGPLATCPATRGSRSAVRSGGTRSSASSTARCRASEAATQIANNYRRFVAVYEEG